MLGVSEMRESVQRIRDFLLDESAADYVGLYEIIWDLSANAADVAEDDRMHVAQELVKELLTQHDASLYRSTVWPPLCWEPVPKEQWQGVLEQLESWRPAEESDSGALFWVAR